MLPGDATYEDALGLPVPARSRKMESNHRLAGYEPGVLPLNYYALSVSPPMYAYYSIPNDLSRGVEGQNRTDSHRASTECSTSELHRHGIHNGARTRVASLRGMEPNH